MKKFNFNNGETRLENQIRTGVDFITACILWGCFDKETGDPLPHTVTEATEEDLEADFYRRQAISEERAAAEYDDSDEFYICPMTGYMHDLEGNILIDEDQTESLN